MRTGLVRRARNRRLILSICLAAAGCDGQSNANSSGPDGPRVLIETNRGRIVLQLDLRASPRSSAQFQRLANAGDYDGVRFHRVLARRQIAAGRDAVDGKPQPPPLVNEWGNGLKHERGTIAFDRSIGDPRVLNTQQLVAHINSARAAFFINLNHNTQYDRRQVDGAGYTVFGRVVEGMDVVDAIGRATVRRNAVTGEPGEPVEPVVILRARTLQDAVKPGG